MCPYNLHYHPYLLFLCTFQSLFFYVSEFIVDPMDETLEVNETDVVLTCTPALSDMNQLINWEIYLRNGTFWVVTGADPERQRRQ